MHARRTWLLLALSVVTTTLFSACATPVNLSANPRPPIVFVHGNGDTAGLWLTTLWRFESNGWPRDRMFALDVPYPSSRDDNGVAQPTRTSTTEHMQALADEVARVRRATGADKVVLIGNSRGGYAIRNYIQNGGGAAVVSHAILGGVPNHGVWASERNPNSEFNGLNAFLKQLNEPKGANGDEVTPGVRWLTLRSDNNDKFAQPDGLWIGQRGVPTNVSFDGPALKGATNVVLPGADHRETSFGVPAFEQTWRFLTGSTPATSASRAHIVDETNLTLNGKVTQLGAAGVGNDATNIVLPGATIEVYEVDPQTGVRRGGVLHRKTMAADESWGPVQVRAGTPYEFVVAAPGYVTVHHYRSPFPRSTSVLNFRVARLADADKAAGSVITMVRPRGYFTRGKDTMSFDGKVPPGIAEGVGGLAVSKLTLPAGAAPRPITGVFGRETITAAAWPVVENRVSVIEFHE